MIHRQSRSNDHEVDEPVPPWEAPYVPAGYDYMTDDGRTTIFRCDVDDEKLKTRWITADSGAVIPESEWR